MTKFVALALSLSFAISLGCKADKVASSNSEEETKAPSAIQATEPLAFRIDGMKRVNGAL